MHKKTEKNIRKKKSICWGYSIKRQKRGKGRKRERERGRREGRREERR